MIRKAALLLLGTVVSIAMSFQDAAACGKEQTRWLKHDGKNRSYQIYKPCTWAPGKPALLVFHPSQSSAKEMSRTLNSPVVGQKMNDLARSRGFMVVYPDGLNNKGVNFGKRVWNDGRGFTGDQAGINNNDDLGFAEKLLDRLVKAEKANPRRIYATGLAMGGAFTYSLMCRFSNRLAGVAPVASHLSDKVMRNCALKNRNLGLLMINGSWDTVAPYCEPNQSLSPLLPNLCRDLQHYDLTRSRPDQADLKETAGDMISVFSTQTLFLRRKGCELASDTPLIDSVAPPEDLTAYKEFQYNCQHGGYGSAKVIALFGGGHVWPGGKEATGKWKDFFIWLVGPISHEISANEMVWDFLKDFKNN